MLCYNKKDTKKVCHYLDCDEIRLIPEDDREYISLSEAKRKGLPLCEECNIAYKIFLDNKSVISALEKKGELTVNLEYDKIHIRSKISEWYVIVAGKNRSLFLYHKNGRGQENDLNARIPGYHTQECYYKTLTGYLEYIVRHDNWRIQNEVIPAFQKKENNHQYKCRKWKAQEKREKKRQRNHDIRATLTLIEALAAEREFKASVLA